MCGRLSVSRVDTNLNAAPRKREIPPPQSQRNQLSETLSLTQMQNFHILKKMLGVITLKIILFALLHNMYR
jgi:hypothetical protein